MKMSFRTIIESGTFFLSLPLSSPVHLHYAFLLAIKGAINISSVTGAKYEEEVPYDVFRRNNC